MSNPTYQVMEVVGVSKENIEQAINNAILQGERLHGKMAWYEVTKTHDFCTEAKKPYYKAHVKIACNAH